MDRFDVPKRLKDAGLCLITEVLSEVEEVALTAVVDAAADAWRVDLRRRVQHYGYRYDYAQRSVDPASWLGPLPSWAEDLGGRLVSGGYLKRPPEQVIVNEYLPGQGISPHIDCLPCFGPEIASISVGSDCAMVFSRQTAEAGEEAFEIILPRRSLLVIAGESRDRWKHGIPARKSDRFGTQRLPRSRRLSFTFRTIRKKT